MSEPIYHDDVMKLMTADAWSEHPQFKRLDWLENVMSKDTQRGYWDWVNAQIEEFENDERNKTTGSAATGA